jgi:hypothetical protein
MTVNNTNGMGDVAIDTGDPDIAQTIAIVERALQRVRDSGLADEMHGAR